MSNISSISNLLQIIIKNNRLQLLIIPVGVLLAKVVGPFGNTLLLIIHLFILEKYFFSEMNDGGRAFKAILPVTRSQIVITDFLFLGIISLLIWGTALIPLDQLFILQNMISLNILIYGISIMSLLMMFFNCCGFYFTLGISFVLILTIFGTSLLNIELSPVINYLSGIQKYLLVLPGLCLLLSLLIVNSRKYNPLININKL